MIRSRSSSISLAWFLSVAAMLACARAPGTQAPGPATATALPARTETAVEVMADPALLRAFGEAAVREQSWDLAYSYLSTIHLLHPESKQDEEAFVWAATAFRGAYEKHRFRPDSVWVGSEPLFVFAWLEEFFADEFPAEQVNTLFRGAPHELVLRFLEFAKTRRALAGWHFASEADNGRTTSVSGERSR